MATTYACDVCEKRAAVFDTLESTCIEGVIFDMCKPCHRKVARFIASIRKKAGLPPWR